MIVNVLDNPAKFSKDAFICKFPDRNCVSVTWKHYVLWKSNKRQVEAGSEMGSDKGKTSDRIQSSVFSVQPMSRCMELLCTPTATVGFDKESASIQALIHAAEGRGIVTLHAKFQLVLVPVVSLEGGVSHFRDIYGYL